MKAFDIQICMKTLSFDRCRNILTDLRVILNLMREQTNYNYGLYIQQAELLLKQKKFDELQLLLQTMCRTSPTYSAELIRNAQLLLENMSEDMKLNGLITPAHVIPCNNKNDNKHI